MKILKKILIFVCIFFPLLTLIYKSQHLNIQLIPKQALDVWQIEIKLNKKNLNNKVSSRPESLIIPIPTSTSSQTVKSIDLRPEENIEKIQETPGGPLIKVSEKLDENLENLSVTSEVQLYGLSDVVSNSVGTESLDELQKTKYTDIGYLDESTSSQIKKLSESLVFDSDSELIKLQKIFFYVSDELILQPETDSLADVLNLSSGSLLGQARLLTALARVNNIPSRIAFGVQILDEEISQKATKYIRVFYMEAFINQRWIPINSHQKLFGSINKTVIVLNRDSESYTDILYDRSLLSIKIEPIKFTTFNSSTYLGKVKSGSSFWSQISLHRFSLSVQTLFLGILLIPFGTVLLSFARVFVGISTFGIFTPILLTLFFLETSFVFASSLFLIVLIIGFSQRFLLDKFHILAVPRLSILLTITVIIYLLFAIISDSFGIMGAGNHTLNYFPIVIITILIERFSIHFVEEGFENTIKTAIGTFIVAAFCYVLLSIVWLKVLLFNNPELLLIAIGLNLMIGSYKGYRLSEYFRYIDLKDSK